MELDRRSAAFLALTGTLWLGLARSAGAPASDRTTPTPAGPSSGGGRVLHDLEFTLLDGAAPDFATFQSHNQLVLANRRGIFVSYLDRDTVQGQLPRANSWSLLRSTDGGRRFTRLYRAEGHTMPPTVETDEDDNIYLLKCDLAPGTGDGSGEITMYKFLASDEYAAPIITALPIGLAVDKFTAFYDRMRQQFYFFPMLDGDFLVIDKNGALLRSAQLLRNGPKALLEYPHIAMDGPRLYLAWTTALPVRPWRYHSIHYMFSDDGGATWSTPALRELTLPVVSDDTGPLPQLVPDRHLGTSSWLASFKAVDGVLHFMYTSGGREIYQRLEASTGTPVTLDGTWEAEGLRILSLDGFFTVRRDGRVLYAIGADGTAQNAEGLTHITVLKSTDNGQSWTGHAKSTRLFHPYALGGARSVSDEAGIIGVFTNWIGSAERAASQQLYFFHVPE